MKTRLCNDADNHADNCTCGNRRPRSTFRLIHDGNVGKVEFNGHDISKYVSGSAPITFEPNLGASTTRVSLTLVVSDIDLDLFNATVEANAKDGETDV